MLRLLVFKKRINKDHRLSRVRSTGLTVIKIALREAELKVRYTCFGGSNRTGNVRIT
jgi:hypothetical protein